MAAATFYDAGLSDIASIEVAHRTLEPLVGSAASTLFGVSLLAAGLSSTTVGTMAGQVVMQGFIHRQIPLWLRRLVTMIPTLIIIGIGVDTTETLVLSQVVLSFGIPFALIPLVLYTSRRDIMGTALVNRRSTTWLAWTITALIVSLNLYLLWATIFG
jgi:manganese transport protein